MVWWQTSPFFLIAIAIWWQLKKRQSSYDGYALNKSFYDHWTYVFFYCGERFAGLATNCIQRLGFLATAKKFKNIRTRIFVVYLKFFHKKYYDYLKQPHHNASSSYLPSLYNPAKELQIPNHKRLSHSRPDICHFP